MAEEVEPDIDSATNGADEDFVLDKENDQDYKHESEEIMDVMWMRLPPGDEVGARARRAWEHSSFQTQQVLWTIQRMHHQPPGAASVVPMHVTSISLVANNFSPSPNDRVKTRKLLQQEAGDWLNPCQTSRQVDIRGGRQTTTTLCEPRPLEGQ